MSLRRQSDFLISVFFVLLLAASVFAEDSVIVVGGNDVNADVSPPDANEPVVDFIKCPDGYDCIRSSDYEKFIEGITTLGTTMIEQAKYMEAIVDRIDKKLTMSEEERQDFVTGFLNLQEDVKEIREEYRSEITLLKHDLKVSRQDLADAAAELKVMRATNMLVYIIILLLCLAALKLYNWAKPQLHFIWRWIQEHIPFRLGNWF